LVADEADDLVAADGKVDVLQRMDGAKYFWTFSSRTIWAKSAAPRAARAMRLGHGTVLLDAAGHGVGLGLGEQRPHGRTRHVRIAAPDRIDDGPGDRGRNDWRWGTNAAGKPKVIVSEASIAGARKARKSFPEANRIDLVKGDVGTDRHRRNRVRRAPSAAGALSISDRRSAVARNAAEAAASRLDHPRSPRTDRA